ncbi:MAG: sugar ABC transporter permease [Xylanivirga thermophila]|jgi:multiple sugar transport system permease protein|uniref:carbohydrate ABC transporter permease n=1 Tax=Xylanivirga thermophila TaxID=2496273 RepID=UPI0039F4E142
MAISTSVGSTKKKSTQEKKFIRLGLLFAMPWMVGFILFQLYPILSSFFYSLTNYNFFKDPDFIGLKNYAELFKDTKFYLSLKNTFYMVLVGVPVKLIYSLFMAMLLNKEVKGQSIYRTVYYMPSIVPIVASSVLWLWILNPQYGILNNILGALHLPQPAWTVDPRYTKVSLVIMDTWRSGGTILIYLAALQGIPRSLYEAADIDGANGWSKFWEITIPSISPVTLFQLIMGLIGAFQYFTQAFIFSSGTQLQVSGGPENSLLFYSLYLYQNGFSFLKMGYASAMAWILFIIIIIISTTILKTSLKWVSYENE